MARLLRFLLVAIVVALCSPATTTRVNALTDVYDAQSNARVDAQASGRVKASPTPVGEVREMSASPSVAVRGTSTTSSGSFIATEAVEIPGTIYRGGGSSPSNLKMRPGEDALSFRDSLSTPLQPGSPVLHPGRDYIGIDTSKLPPGSVVPDGVPGSALTPPGHVSVYVTDPDVLKAAIIEKGKFPK